MRLISAILTIATVTLSIALAGGCESTGPQQSQQARAESTTTQPQTQPAPVTGEPPDRPAIEQATEVSTPTTEVKEAAPAEPNPVSKAVKSKPQITFDKIEHDFGEIEPGSKHTCEFTFKNTGNGLLKIQRVRATCGCTALQLEKKEYKPGESGSIKVAYTSSQRPGSATKYAYVTSNDPDNETVKLSIKSTVALKVTVVPDKLSLSLEKENAGCPDITITSADGNEFSIKKVVSPGNCITAEFDPARRAKQFTLRPEVNIEKLRDNLRGVVTININHPDVQRLTLNYYAPPDFQTRPGTLFIQNAIPGETVQRKLWVTSNYDQDFQVESISSQKGTIEAVNFKTQQDHLEVTLNITPPEPTGSLRYSRDVLETKIKGGPTLKTNCTFLYKKDSAN